MSTFNFLNLSELAFETQFLKTVELNAQEDGPVKRYQVTSQYDGEFVLEAKNQYDLWLKLNDRYSQLDVCFINHIFECLEQDDFEKISAELVTMSDFVKWYMPRFMEKGSFLYSVYEIAEDEYDYFDEPGQDEDEDEEDDDEDEDEDDDDYEDEDEDDEE